jgi:hypothetical protein
MVAIWWLTNLARVGLSPTGIIDLARPHTPLIYPTYCVHLAIALSELRKPEKACDELQMAVKIDQFGQETRRIDDLQEIIGICS